MVDRLLFAGRWHTIISEKNSQWWAKQKLKFNISWNEIVTICFTCITIKFSKKLHFPLKRFGYRIPSTKYQVSTIQYVIIMNTHANGDTCVVFIKFKMKWRIFFIHSICFGFYILCIEIFYKSIASLCYLELFYVQIFQWTQIRFAIPFNNKEWTLYAERFSTKDRGKSIHYVKRVIVINIKYQKMLWKMLLMNFPFSDRHQVNECIQLIKLIVNQKYIKEF